MASSDGPQDEAARKPDGPFASPLYRMVWFGFAMSSFGTVIQNVGAAWLMTSITQNPTWPALVQASNTLPVMMFSIVAAWRQPAPLPASAERRWLPARTRCHRRSAISSSRRPATRR